MPPGQRAQKDAGAGPRQARLPGPDGVGAAPAREGRFCKDWRLTS